jgi:hypothetical protein
MDGVCCVACCYCLGLCERLVGCLTNAGALLLFISEECYLLRGLHSRRFDVFSVCCFALLFFRYGALFAILSVFSKTKRHARQQSFPTTRRMPEDLFIATMALFGVGVPKGMNHYIGAYIQYERIRPQNRG